MKVKVFTKILMTSILLLVLIPGFSQKLNKPISAEEALKQKCGEYISAYRTFFTMELYDYAMIKWIEAFNECPESSERMYIDGVTMYRSFIEDAPQGPEKERKIDSLLLIYDRRMEYFGGEGNILGRKGRDLLTYRGGDIDEVAKAYDMLRRSVELEREKSRESAVLLLISSGITLNQAGRMEISQVFDDYFLLSGFLDQGDSKSSRIKRTRERMDDLMLSKNILNCETLDAYFAEKVEQNKEDVNFQLTLTRTYSLAVCELSDIFLQAEVNLYRLKPGPESAHELGMAFLRRKEYDKAVIYVKEALEAQDIDMSTRSEWNYDLARVQMELRDYCEAIEYAREAVKLNPDLGKAYILLGDAFINSRSNLGDDFQQRTAFWAAADMYSKAASADPLQELDAEEKLADIQKLFPSKEEVFFRDLKIGDPYPVGGCINETTTVK